MFLSTIKYKSFIYGLLAIVLSIVRFTASEYHVGISKLFLKTRIQLHKTNQTFNRDHIQIASYCRRLNIEIYFLCLCLDSPYETRQHLTIELHVYIFIEDVAE